MMRRLSVLALAAVLLVALAVPAYAGGRHRGGNTATNVALGLASFAVFNQLMGSFTDNHRDNHRWHTRTFVYEQQPVVFAAPAPVAYQMAPVVVAPPPPPPPQTVYYPHGRYEFSGSQWVWIPNAPAAPPPSASACQPTGKYVKTPQGILPECQ
ncbi:MAG: hypothetical protein HY474_01450 [Candidatus Sungbacteria bacterium]|uniref:Uncharacterized protein n=1 Tax=Candidatus Sungiibacteriota bacterium TaxID=2750080 RepID=A0A932YYF2_9BACT|nr:hypothetical protein [Candidatus Sungbacteria bacterium]